MSAVFHANSDVCASPLKFAIELLGFLRMRQSTLAGFPGIGVHKSNLLEARVVIQSIISIVRLLSPEPLVGLATPKCTQALGADIVRKSLS